jgi:hypothetical protein
MSDCEWHPAMDLHRLPEKGSQLFPNGPLPREYQIHSVPAIRSDAFAVGVRVATGAAVGALAKESR